MFEGENRKEKEERKPITREDINDMRRRFFCGGGNNNVAMDKQVMDPLLRIDDGKNVALATTLPLSNNVAMETLPYNVVMERTNTDLIKKSNSKIPVRSGLLGDHRLPGEQVISPRERISPRQPIPIPPSQQSHSPRQPSHPPLSPWLPKDSPLSLKLVKNPTLITQKPRPFYMNFLPKLPQNEQVVLSEEDYLIDDEICDQPMLVGCHGNLKKIFSCHGDNYAMLLFSKDLTPTEEKKDLEKSLPPDIFKPVSIATVNIHSNEMETLLREVKSLKISLEMLKRILKEQERRERAKDALIRKLLAERER